MSEIVQFIRRVNLIVDDGKGNTIDLSGLRIFFKIEKTGNQAPNTAVFIVTNVKQSTMDAIRNEFTNITIQAGYESNYGVIFTGNIKQTRTGKEDNNTDTYIKIYAADGDLAYNFSTISYTLASGAKISDQVNAAVKPMNKYGVTAGNIDDLDGETLPRGKVMYGHSRDYLREVSRTKGVDWSIQNGKIQVVKLTGTLNEPAVVLNNKTGLKGRAERTENGIMVECLLNPLIQIYSKVKIDQQFIIDQDSDPDLNLPDNATKEQREKYDAKNKKLVDISADGFYKVIAIQYEGDTRANEWYTKLTCIDVDATKPQGKDVNPNG